MKKSFYRGENSRSKLLCTLPKWYVWCYSQKQKFCWLKILKSERERIINVHFAECCICGKEAQVSTRVIHHCHLSGKVFGVAHSKCNLQARTTNSLPVFFHNFSRYDSHHVLKNLKLEKGEKLSAIARTDETFTSITLSMPVVNYTDKKNRIVRLFHSSRFLDSLQFMSQSFESLAKTLKNNDFALLRQHFSSVPDQVFKKLTKKGFSPYSFLDSFQKFDEPLPPLGIDWKNLHWDSGYNS